MPLIGGTAILSRKEILDRLRGSRWIELQFLKIFPLPGSLSLLRKILALSSVVYVKNEVLDLIPVLVAKHDTNTPVVCGVHTALHYFDWRSLRAVVHNNAYSSVLYGHLLSACDIIHVLNPDDKKFLEKILYVDSSKVYEVPLWIDHEHFEARTRKKDNHYFRILFIGGLDIRKGIDVFLQGIAQLFKESLEKFIQMSFTIIGKGPLIGYVREAQAKYGNINYKPFITGSKVDLYNEHDVLVVPSRGETFSYVTLEALSCGLPVIASDIPGPRSLIENERTGILFPVGDVPALAKAILSMHSLWTDRARYENMRSECRRFALRDFSPNSILNVFEKMLKRAASMKLSGGSKQS